MGRCDSCKRNEPIVIRCDSTPPIVCTAPASCAIHSTNNRPSCSPGPSPRSAHSAARNTTIIRVYHHHHHHHHLRRSSPRGQINVINRNHGIRVPRVIIGTVCLTRCAESIANRLIWCLTDGRTDTVRTVRRSGWDCCCRRSLTRRSERRPRPPPLPSSSPSSSLLWPLARAASRRLRPPADTATVD